MAEQFPEDSLLFGRPHKIGIVKDFNFTGYFILAFFKVPAYKNTTFFIDNLETNGSK